MEGSHNRSGPSTTDEVVMQNDIPNSEEQSNDHVIEKSKDSDTESVASGSSNDSEMEPFEDYLPKIEILLDDIGLHGFSVQPLHHGYQYMNCVYALTSPKDEKERYVLRIPNCPVFEDATADYERCPAILNDAACLNYLADKLPVPRVKAYCATRENALSVPFTVQTMLLGQSLDHVYEDMSQAEKFAIIDQIVELQVKLEAVTFATAGTFIPAPGMPDMMCDFLTPATPSIKMFSQGHEEFVKEPQSLRDRSGPDVKALLVNHLNGWIKWEEANMKVHVSNPFQTFVSPLVADRKVCDMSRQQLLSRHTSYPLSRRNADHETTTGNNSKRQATANDCNAGRHGSSRLLQRRSIPYRLIPLGPGAAEHHGREKR